MEPLKSLCMEIVAASPHITVDDDRIFQHLQTQPDMAWIIDAKAKGVLFNEKVLKYFRKTQEQLVDWAWQDFMPDEEIARVAPTFYNALDSGQMWEQIYPVRDWHGDFRQYLVRAAPLYGKSGEINYWLGCGMDITDIAAHFTRKSDWFKHYG